MTAVLTGPAATVGLAVAPAAAVGLAGAGQAATVALVAQPTPPPADPGGRGEDFGKSAPVGLVVIILFFVAVFFLVRSMNKHLRRVPASFDPPESQPSQPSQPSPSSQAQPAAGPADDAPPPPADRKD